MAIIKFNKEQRRQYAIEIKESKLVRGIDPGSPAVKRDAAAFRAKIAEDLKRLKLTCSAQ